MTAVEALTEALAAVWSGANDVDAEAVVDQLDDLGFKIVERAS